MQNIMQIYVHFIHDAVQIKEHNDQYFQFNYKIRTEQIYLKYTSPTYM